MLSSSLCFNAFSTRTVVKLGEHNLNTTIDCEHGQCADPPQVIYAKTVIVPKEFDTLTLKHDVALIELSEPANFSDYVSPVCLPTGDLIHKSLLNEIVEVSRLQGRRLKFISMFLYICGLLAGDTLMLTSHNRRRSCKS